MTKKQKHRMQKEQSACRIAWRGIPRKPNQKINPNITDNIYIQKAPITLSQGFIERDYTCLNVQTYWTQQIKKHKDLFLEWERKLK